LNKEETLNLYKKNYKKENNSYFKDNNEVHTFPLTEMDSSKAYKKNILYVTEYISTIMEELFATEVSLI
jgi:hypothetical protein